MQPNVGDIFEGKVTGITKFGAFVAAPEGKTGLVHISEITNAYVADISEHISVSQVVRVKVIGISPDGRINLSMKQALPREAKQQRTPTHDEKPRFAAKAQQTANTAGPKRAASPEASADASFEDKLKQFMHDSDCRISDSRTFSDKKGRYRRRRD